MNAKDIFNKLAAIETDFFDGKTTFFSPILSGRETRISTRIANVEYVFPAPLSTKRESGWYIFRALDHKRAKIVRAATMEEIEAYQKIFAKKRLILIQRNEDHWLGLDSDSEENDVLPIFLSDNVELFDYVEAIVIGSLCWFVAPYTRRDPVLIESLREAFQKNTKNPNITGLSPSERKAYAIAGALREEALKGDTQRRLEKSLEMGKAKLIDYKEQGNVLTVQWEFDGRRQSSTVRKGDLTVITAGICLSGTDQRFDLTSLPSVFREALRTQGRLPPMH